MPTDLHPLIRADDLIDRAHAILTRWCDGDPSPSTTPGHALGIIDQARAALQDYHADYEPEHARPEPVTVGARRALESIRDMTDGRRVGDPVSLARIYEAALRGLVSITEIGMAHNDAAAEQAAPVRQALADPDAPDPTIEVLPLPGDRFLLVLSGWPGEPDCELHARLREQTGAAGVYVCPFYVSVPDGTRTGVNAATLVASSLPPRMSSADLLAAVAAYVQQAP